MRLITLSKWFIAFGVMTLVSVPQQSHSGEREDRIAAACGATAVVDGTTALAAGGCYAQGVILQELETCLTGGECVGPSNDLLGCNGWLMHNIFGMNCGDATGPGFTTLVNKNPHTIRFFVASPTGPTATIDIGPNMFWTTPYRFVTYRMNFPNGSNDQNRTGVEGKVLHNGSSYRFVGSQSHPGLACEHARNSPINDPRDPCD